MIVKGFRALFPTLAGTEGLDHQSHYMLAYGSASVNKMKSILQPMKDAGETLFWAYTDRWEGDYPAKALATLDAAQEIGMTVSFGGHGGMAGQQDIDMMLAVKDHPAVHKIGGKPVYTYYQWNKGLYQNTLNLLAANGISRNDYVLLVNTQYATEITYTVNTPQGVLLTGFRNGTISSPYLLVETNQTFVFYDDTVIYENYSNYPHFNDKALPFMLDTYGINGLVNFAVDKSLQACINENLWVSAACKAKSKIFVAGLSFSYASTSFHHYGYSGLAQLLDGILVSKPEMTSFTTANDKAELTYVRDDGSTAIAGLYYAPEPEAGFHYDNNTRFILTDHTGVYKFSRPWIEAHKAGEDNPVFTQDKMFCCYWLHPVDAALIPTIPSEVSALGSHFNQSWWDQTLYKLGNQNVPGIKTNFATQIGKISMTAQLATAGYLQIVINGQTYTSPIKAAGVAHWECPQALGTPVFSILNSDMSTRITGQGQQAITNSIVKGGWNYLATEITPA